MSIEDIIKPENLVYQKSKLLTEKPFHYCPGCGHGTIHRIVAEVIEELGIDEDTIGVAPVGCSVMAYDYFDQYQHHLQQSYDGQRSPKGTGRFHRVPEIRRHHVRHHQEFQDGVGHLQIRRHFRYSKKLRLQNRLYHVLLRQ